MLRPPPTSTLFPYTTLFRSDDLRPQFERCKEFLEKFGVPMYSLPGYEADDVIGALAKQAEAAGLDTVILSGDRKSTRLNSSHRCISYAVFCLKKKNNNQNTT